MTEPTYAPQGPEDARSSGQKTFSWTDENAEIAAAHIRKYPEGKQKAAILPLLHLAQRQNGGWLPTHVIEFVAEYLKMPYIRAYEVATFYTMFNLVPVGKFHVQLCGTTPCWLRGSDDVMRACRDMGMEKGKTTEDGLFTLTEVECLGACVNAPMVQINDDYYEDLDYDRTKELLEALKAGRDVTPGPQIERQTSAPVGGPTTLKDASEANR